MVQNKEKKCPESKLDFLSGIYIEHKKNLNFIEEERMLDTFCIY